MQEGSGDVALICVLDSASAKHGDRNSRMTRIAAAAAAQANAVLANAKTKGRVAVLQVLQHCLSTPSSSSAGVPEAESAAPATSPQALRFQVTTRAQLLTVVNPSPLESAHRVVLLDDSVYSGVTLAAATAVLVKASVSLERIRFVTISTCREYQQLVQVPLVQTLGLGDAAAGLGASTSSASFFS